MKLSVKAKLLGVLTLVLCISIGGMLFALLYQEEDLKHKQAETHVNELSFALIQSIIYIMDQGADDVSPIVKEVSKLEKLSELRVIPSVEISEEKAAKMDSLEKKVIKTKQKITYDEVFKNIEVNRAIFPIIATESCTNCHSANVGDAIATISIRYSVQETHDAILGQRMNGTIMLIIIVLLSLGFLYIALNRLVINDLKKTTNLMTKFSEGDLSDEIINTRNDEFGLFLDSMQKVQGSIKMLTDDVIQLSDSANRGELDIRADLSKHNGDFRTIVAGVNTTLDNVIGPLNVAAEYVDRISKGDIPPKINDEYKGDFNAIKNNLNVLIDATNSVTHAAKNLAVGNTNISLKKRCAKDEMIESLIKLVDSTNIITEVAKKLSLGNTNVTLEKRSNEDQMIDSLINVINLIKHDAENLQSIASGNLDFKVKVMSDDDVLAKSTLVLQNTLKTLIVDMNMLAKAAEDGKLHTRADVSKHKGEFGKIVKGVNDTLDNVIGPLSLAAKYVDLIAKGDIPTKIKDEYKGEFNEIKNNLNMLIDATNMVTDVALKLSVGNINVELEKRCQNDSMIAALQKVISKNKNDADSIRKMSEGIVDINIEIMSNDDTLAQSCMILRDTLKLLISDANNLTIAALNGKLDTRADSSKHKGGFKEIVVGINQTLDAVIGPLNVAAEYVDRISKGDIPPRITDEYKGDFNEIKNNLNQCIDSVNALVSDAMMLATAGVDGRLSTRANAHKHNGEFRKIVQGVNDTLDAVIGPLNVAANYVNRISKGDIPELITDDYNGDFNEIKNNLNQCINAINLLVKDANKLSVAAIEGKLDIRADASKHNGDFSKIVQGVNATLDNVIGPLNVAAEYVDRISKGDIPPKITEEYKGDFNEIKNNLNQAIDSVNALVVDAKMLAKAGVEGRLATRADVNKHSGDFRAIVQGVNDTLDAVIGPLNVAAEYVDKISKGDIPQLITKEYNGDFNLIKNNLNTCIKAINALVSDASMLSNAAINGKLDTRANATKHNGDFRAIVQGVNTTLDNVIGPLNVAAEYVDRISKGDIPPRITDEYKGDFNEIKNNLNQCISAISLLVEDATMLVDAAVEGSLSTRADENRHNGDFRKIVQGVNKTLDTVIKPINEAGTVLEILATGDLTARVIGDYQGDHQNLKISINSLGDSLSHLINQVNEAVHSSASSSMEISSTAESLAAATQEQSAQSDEVASAVEEMSRTITENAQSANKTYEVAQENGRIAREGGKVVQQTVEKMRDIAKVVQNSAENIQKLGESSTKIGEIISVIDDIADQTNLLALNAAIEAARAGEQGRGFAVVADEVRKLAERTSTATKEISNMIKGIQNETQLAVVAMNKGTMEVQTGIKLADDAGKSLSEILSSTEEVLDMINQIAAASEEQSATSEQISKNVVSISKVTAESAGRIEDVAHTAEGLAKITEYLSSLMLQFKVDDNTNMQLTGKNQLQLNVYDELK